jgi:hypothetical protein
LSASGGDYSAPKRGFAGFATQQHGLSAQGRAKPALSL